MVRQRNENMEREKEKNRGRQDTNREIGKREKRGMEEPPPFAMERWCVPRCALCVMPAYDSRANARVRTIQCIY